MNMFVNNTIVQECLHNAMYNANTVIGYKLALFSRKKLTLICLKMILIRWKNVINVYYDVVYYLLQYLYI